MTVTKFRPILLSVIPQQTDESAKECGCRHYECASDLNHNERPPKRQSCAVEIGEPVYYEDNYSCRPPPFFIIIITLVQISVFFYSIFNSDGSTSSNSVSMDSPLIYRSDKKIQLWRFVSYISLHAGWLHLSFNLAVQLIVGIPLEMVHGSFRVGAIYMAGALAGSLGTSVFDSDVYLVGASGGVYALLMAHVANLLLNYKLMEYGLIKLFCIFLIATIDIGFTLYDRCSAPAVPAAPSSFPVSYVSHATGALTGLLVGLIVLKSFVFQNGGKSGGSTMVVVLRWTAFIVYFSLIAFALMYNLLDSQILYSKNVD